MMFDDARNLADFMERSAKVIREACNLAEASSGILPLDPWRTLKLSIRTRNCLHDAGIDTIEKLIRHSSLDLLEIRNLGQTSLDELKRQLAKHDLSLRGESP